MTETEYVLAGNTARLSAVMGAMKGMIYPDKESRERLAALSKLVYELHESTLARCHTTQSDADWTGDE